MNETKEEREARLAKEKEEADKEVWASDIEIDESTREES